MGTEELQQQQQQQQQQIPGSRGSMTAQLPSITSGPPTLDPPPTFTSSSAGGKRRSKKKVSVSKKRRGGSKAVAAGTENGLENGTGAGHGPGHGPGPGPGPPRMGASAGPPAKGAPPMSLTPAMTAASPGMMSQHTGGGMETPFSQTSLNPSQEVIRVLRNRATALEAELEKARARMARAEKDAEGAYGRAREANRRIAQLKKDHEDALQALSAKHESDMLAMREEHTRHMAAVTGADMMDELNAEANAQAKNSDGSMNMGTGDAGGAAVADQKQGRRRPRSGSRGSKRSGSRDQMRVGAVTSAASHANRLLIQQLEEVQQQLARTKETFEEERHRINRVHVQEMREQESTLRGELNVARDLSAAQEDRIMQLDEEVREAKRAQDLAERKEREMERKKLAAEQESVRLREDIQTMQSSVAQTMKIETTQGLTTDDPNGPVKAMAAQSEARARQLSNKVEFLKAQIAAEAQTRAEMEEKLADANRRVEEAKQLNTAKVSEAEARKQGAVQEAEERARRQMEERLGELTKMQQQIMALQSQLQNAVSDSAVSKQREENARSDFARAEALNAAYVQEIEQLRAHVDELVAIREENDMLKQAKTASDAMMRRLDNEREYLKSQLGSEITLKNELQAMLDDTNKQLQDAKRAWQADVDKLQAMRRDEKSRLEDELDRISEHKLSLESEAERQVQQANEARDALAKTRDNLRDEREANEMLTAECRRLKDDLHASEQEIARRKEAQEGAMKQQGDNMAAVQESLRQVEALKAREVNRLKEELRVQFDMTNTAQRETITTREEMANAARRHALTVAAARVAGSLSKWHDNRLQQSFRDWKRGVLVRDMESECASRVDLATEIANEEANRRHNAAVAKLRDRLAQEEAERLSALNAEHDSFVEQLRTDLAREQEEAVKQALDDAHAVFAESEQEWRDKLSRMEQNMISHKARCDRELEQEKERIAAEARQNLDKALSAAQARWAKDKDEALAARAAEHAQAMADAEQLWTERNEAAMQRLQEQNEARVQSLIKKRDEQFEEMRTRLEHEKAEALALAASHEKAATELRERLETERESTRKTIEELTRQAEEDKQAALDAAQLAHEKDVERLRTQWGEDLDDALANQRALEEKARVKALAEQEAQLTALKSNAVKMEAAKWTRALKESEQRLRADVEAARSAGWNDRDSQADTQSRDLQQAADKAIEQLRLEAIAAQQDMQARHAQALDSLRKRLDQEHAETLSKTLEEQEANLNAAFDARLNESLATRSAELQKLMEDRVAEAMAETSRVRYTLEQAKKAAQDKEAELRDANVEARARTERVRLMGEKSLKEAREKWEQEKEGLFADFEEQKISLIQEKAEAQAKALAEAAQAAQQDKEAALKECTESMTAEMEAAMLQLQEESERLIGGLETAVDKLKTEKEALEQDVAKKAHMLEEAEDTIYDMQNEMKKKQQEQSFKVVRLAAAAMRMRELFRQKLQELRDEFAASSKTASEKAQAALDDMRNRAERIGELLQQAENYRTQMNDVLMNHKTNVLVERRQTIRVLESELVQMAEERDLLLEQKEALSAELGPLEESVRELEEEIEEHSRRRSIINGRVHVPHARKKRRLNEELESLLETVENKRAQIESVENRLKTFAESKEQKEQEMMQMEQELVQVLIEQQKMVLGLINDAKSIDEQGRLLLQLTGMVQSLNTFDPPAPPGSSTA